MKYLSFSLENYKGISEEISIDISNKKSVSCIIGDNESGKTTILRGLELIGYLCKTFQSLKNGSLLDIRPKGFEFTGKAILSCFVEITEEEINEIKETTIKDRIKEERGILKIIFSYPFKDHYPIKDEQKIEIKIGDSMDNFFSSEFKKIIKKGLPDIIYHETFHYEIPNKISFLRKGKTDIEKNSPLKKKGNKEWQLIFDDIINGVMTEPNTFQQLVVDWPSDDKDTTSNRLNQMGDYISEKVGANWKDITGKGAVLKDFLIKETTDSAYKYYVIKIKNKGVDFDISDRSLGAQWFFCFKIYTEIRKNRGETIFLLDEPASNLHIDPQKKILNSVLFELVDKNTSIIYSTHSPYLIDVSKDKDIIVVKNTSNDNKKLPNIKCEKVDKMTKIEKDDNSFDPIRDSIIIYLSSLVDEKKLKKYFQTIKKKVPKTIYSGLKFILNEKIKRMFFGEE